MMGGVGGGGLEVGGEGALHMMVRFMGDRSQLTRHRHILPVKKCRPTLDLFQPSLNCQAERQASRLVSGACALLFGLLTLKTFHSTVLFRPDSKNCPTNENRCMNGTPNTQGASPNTQNVISNTHDRTSGTPDTQDMTLKHIGHDTQHTGCDIQHT